MTDHLLEIILSARDISQRGFAQFQNRIKAVTSSVFSFRGAIATLAGTGGLGLLVKNSIDAADKIGKTADKLGLSTKALQEYRFAATQSGVSTETLDMAMQRFTRRAAEAYQGTGELKGILEKYHISVKNVNGSMRSSEDIFSDLADVIGSTESSSERLRIAFKAFDSEGAALVNMLKNGSAGMNKFKAEAESLGIIIDEDLIRNAEKASDQLDVLGKVVSSNVTSAVLELAPTITKIVEQITNWTRENKEFISVKVPEYLDKAVKASENIWNIISREPAILEFGLIGLVVGGKKGLVIGSALGHFVEWAENLGTALAMVDKGLLEMSDVATANFTELEKLISKVGDESPKILALKNKISDLKKEISAMSRITYWSESTVKQYETLKKELDEAESSLRSYQLGIDDTTESSHELWTATTQMASAHGQQKDVVDDVSMSVQELTKSFGGLEIKTASVNELFNNLSKNNIFAINDFFDFDFPGYAGIEEFADEIIAIEKSFKDLGSGPNPFMPAIQGAEEFSEKASKTYRHFLKEIQDLTADTFSDIFKGNIRGWEDMTDRMSDYFADVMGEIFSQALFEGENLFDSLSGSFSKLSGSIGNLGAGALYGFGGYSTASNIFGSGPSKEGSIGSLLGGAGGAWAAGTAAGSSFLGSLGIASAALGPVGAILGGILGGSLGGLFHKKETNYALGPFGGSWLQYGETDYLGNLGTLSEGAEGGWVPWSTKAEDAIRTTVEGVWGWADEIIEGLPAKLANKVQNKLSSASLFSGIEGVTLNSKTWESDLSRVTETLRESLQTQITGIIDSATGEIEAAAAATEQYNAIFKDASRYMAEVTGTATDLDKALWSVDDRFASWMDGVNEGSNLFVWLNDQWQRAIEVTTKSIQDATEAQSGYNETLSDRESVSALQRLIFGASSDEIRLSQIADRYGWAGAGLIEPTGAYNWQGIASSLSKIGTATPQMINAIAEGVGLTFGEVTGDIEYVANLINSSGDIWSEVIDKSTDLINSIDNTISGIKYSDLNVGLPSQILKTATIDYAELVSKAKSGDIEAAQEFMSFAPTYLQLEQDVKKSSPAYQDVYSTVISDLEYIRGIAGEGAFNTVSTGDSINNLADLMHIDLSNVGGTLSEQLAELKRQNEILAALLSSGQSTQATLMINGDPIDAYIVKRADQVADERDRKKPRGTLYS